MKQFTSLLLPLMLLTNAPLAFAQVAPQDSLALVAIYEATNGPEWIDQTNWLTTAPVGEWFGVNVQNGRVYQLFLFSNNLQGTLPGAIGNLTATTRIDIGGNPLGGELPDEIGNMTALEQLNISHCNFTGAIPMELANCSNFHTFYANDNAFTGEFPPVLLLIPTIRYLDLGDNQFSGVLPPELSQLTELRQLALDRNQFEGEMISLKEMTLLSSCYLTYNHGLSGDVGDFLGTAMNLYELTLDGNQFTGCLSESYFNPSTLSFLEFAGNDIDCIGDFSTFVESGSLIRISPSTNRIPFEFLESNRGTPEFEYHPQKQLLEPSIQSLHAGDSLVIQSGSGGLYTKYRWFRDGKVIPGETDAFLEIQDFDEAQEGVYHCEMTNDSLPLLTLRRSPVTLTLEPTSSIGSTMVGQLTLFPNPAADLITIPNLAPGSEVRIYDTTGNLHLHTQTGALHQVNISTLPPGSYVISALSNLTNQTGRFTKK